MNSFTFYLIETKQSSKSSFRPRVFKPNFLYIFSLEESRVAPVNACVELCCIDLIFLQSCDFLFLLIKNDGPLVKLRSNERFINCYQWISRKKHFEKIFLMIPTLLFAFEFFSLIWLTFSFLSRHTPKCFWQEVRTTGILLKITG